MYNPDTDLIFPPRAILALAEERGPSWKDLLTKIEKCPPDSLDQTALILLMARMNTCTTCNSNSFRAMNGCATCARQSLKRFRGSDEELIGLYLTAKKDVDDFLHNRSTK